MKFISKHLLLSTLLIAGWMMAYAQSNGSPAQRIGLTVVDNKSTYVIDDEQNNYENTLRLSQPEGSYPLIAGMLNNGDNYITFHRIDDLGRDTTFACINLAAEMSYPPLYAGQIDFYGDGSNLPSSETTMTQSMLPANWGTDGTKLILQTNGSAYVTGNGGLTFTVPSGYSNDTLQLVVELGTNLRDGYFTYNLNDGGWYVITKELTAGETVILMTFNGINSGDVISLAGGRKDGDTYYISATPDLRMIGFREIPKTIIPSATVTPKISYWDGESWSEETAMDGVGSTAYSVNDLFDLSGLGNVTDTFSESTAENQHPSEYQYRVDFTANIVLPPSGSTGLDFLASVDFSLATTSDAYSSSFNGPNNWTFYGTTVYKPAAGRCCYMQRFGSVLYIMPDSFMGNSVNVTVTSSSGDGDGDMYLNGALHTFAAGETYTWSNVPVRANGAIELKGVGTALSIDFTSIVISSGNGATLNVPNVTGKAEIINEDSAYPFDTEKKVEDNAIEITVK